VAPKAKGAQFLIYRASQITSFELKAYYPKALGLRAYRSQDGSAWMPLTSTNPAPAVGGKSYLAELQPNEPIPAGTNRLKVEFTARDTELARGGSAVDTRLC
jgi:hypothetical protein